MDFELRAAREKLEREQRQRKEKARLKLEREWRANAEAARQHDDLEAAQRARRVEAAQAQIANVLRSRVTPGRTSSAPGKALHREEMEKHMKVFHEPLYCGCGVSLEQESMVIHQSSVCPLCLITCRYCGDMVPAGTFPSDVGDRMRGLSEHESVCGSRTAPCDSCGRSVMLKDMEIHRIAVHQKN